MPEGEDISYELSITASDLANNSSVLDLSIILTDDTGSAPEFASASASVDVNESTGGIIYTAVATDADPDQSLIYALSGSDSQAFSLDPNNGELSFNSIPDHENPLDQDGDNVYELTISATDPLGKQALSVSVINANDTYPQFSLSSNSFSVSENTSAVTSVSATDADGDTLSFALITNSDANYFVLDPSSGELTFAQAPDYESPQDSGRDNVYELDLSAFDGKYTTYAAIDVSVSNVNEAPSFTSASVDLSTAENVNFVHTVEAATDEDQGESLTYELSGTDKADFNFNASTRQLSFVATPNYENPADSGRNNNYQVSITATDGEYSASQNLSIEVTNVNEAPSASISVSPDPSSTSLSTLTAVSLDGSSSSDPDGDSLAYTWSQPSSQAIDLSSPNSASTSFTAAVAGTYSFTLTVADGALASSAEVALEIASASILPDDFIATAASAQVTLAWTPYSDSTTYNIYRSTDPDCDLDSYATACSSSAGALFPSVVPGFIDSNLTNGTTYYYWIEASLNGSTQRAASPISATPQQSAIAEPIPGTISDTGVDWGGDYDNGNNSDCSSNVSAPQDCHQGRDATHDDDSDGHAGFSFTKLDSAGDALEADAWSWSCVQDNVTGLIWEVKNSYRNSLHYRADKFNWYGTDAATNADVGRADDDGAICNGYDSSDPATYCNTKAFVARVNAAGLCGASDWRLPSMGELRSIQDYSREEPGIDTNYFPHTRSDYYWSNILKESFGELWPWVMDFDDASESGKPSDGKIYVRLVRSNQ